MYTCPPYSQCQLRLVCIVTWKHGCPCVAVCLCPIHLICVPSTCLECVHASVYVLMPTWVLNSTSSPMHGNMETWVSVCGTVYVAVISFLFPHLVYNVYMHQYMYICQPEFWILLHPICVGTWKDGCECVCCNHPTSSATPFLECVYSSVHGFMSTWLPISAPHPLNCFMKTWVPQCGIVCLSQPAYFRSQTMFRMCTCISTSVYVHLTLHFSSTPFEYLHGNMAMYVWHCEFVTITPFLVPDLG